MESAWKDKIRAYFNNENKETKTKLSKNGGFEKIDEVDEEHFYSSNYTSENNTERQTGADVANIKSSLKSINCGFSIEDGLFENGPVEPILIEREVEHEIDLSKPTLKKSVQNVSQSNSTKILESVRKTSNDSPKRSKKKEFLRNSLIEIENSHDIEQTQNSERQSSTKPKKHYKRRKTFSNQFNTTIETVNVQNSSTYQNIKQNSDLRFGRLFNKKHKIVEDFYDLNNGEKKNESLKFNSMPEEKKLIKNKFGALQFPQNLIHLSNFKKKKMSIGEKQSKVLNGRHYLDFSKKSLTVPFVFESDRTTKNVEKCFPFEQKVNTPHP